MYIQTAAADDALQQTISRVFAIVLRQVYGMDNITMMALNDTPNARLTEEQRVDNQRYQLSESYDHPTGALRHRFRFALN